MNISINKMTEKQTKEMLKELIKKLDDLDAEDFLAQRGGGII